MTFDTVLTVGIMTTLYKTLKIRRLMKGKVDSSEVKVSVLWPLARDVAHDHQNEEFSPC